MSGYSADWPAPDVVLDEAEKLAKKLGHAAVILCHIKLPDDWTTADAWTPTPDGYAVWAYVSLDGKVRRLA